MTGAMQGESMSKVCEAFKAKDGSLFGHEYSHQPGGPCRHYVHPGACTIANLGKWKKYETEGFKVIPRADQESDGEV